ncbi:MAG: 30S ribosomal protein S24e [Candidatus Altiarchaeales archaeon ex4484_2]|nr:MAG: 30S ribosomal protein S24e [Candidatus Altiarchaeales archaeon ex4484_2]
MDVEIIEERDNPLLKRREYEFIISFEGATPPRGDVRKKLVSVLNSENRLTVLDSYTTEYGMNKAKGLVKVYFDEDSMGVEPKYLLSKNFPAEKPAENKKENEGD